MERLGILGSEGCQLANPTTVIVDPLFAHVYLSYLVPSFLILSNTWLVIVSVFARHLSLSEDCHR
jgi:hypothetical protein